jgi:hypothetical protein
MFYPHLTRHDKYDLKDETDETSFYSYSHYREVIEKDCLNRCVYCDVLLTEHAYEGMHLDHFRPQKHFSSLSSDPRNLVLTCPKCNRLKSCHWPCEKVITKPSHNGKNGFVDPFVEDISEYIEVKNNGELIPIKGPAPYFISLLKLNRDSRIQVRRRRILLTQKERIVEAMISLSEDLINDLISGIITKEEAEMKRDIIELIKEEYRNLKIP